MNPAEIIAGVLQIVQLGVHLTPAVLRAIKDYEDLFADGKSPSPEDLAALLDRVRTQSEAIQAQPD
jgi:hypothetical protein